MATTLAEHISLNKTQDQYVSKHIPQRMGNSAPIAYGGYAVGLSIHAACKVAPPGFHLYSALGHYLQPVSTERHITCKPVQLRLTRNFATYRVSVEQKVPSGETRVCMELLADFHKEEPSLLEYHAVPSQSYSHWEACPSWSRVQEEGLKSGKVSEREAKVFNVMFGLGSSLWDTRPCPEGVASQNLCGVAKRVKTSQDDRKSEDKASADWIKVKHPLQNEGEQVAGLGFVLDSALSFLPLTHNHMFFDDVGACSSLDFALRIFKPGVRVDEWHLREMKGHRAGFGRSFSESKLWDESGHLVASMTQQSILRVPAKSKM